MKRIPLERRMMFIMAGEHAAGGKYWAVRAAYRIKMIVQNNYRRRVKNNKCPFCAEGIKEGL